MARFSSGEIAIITWSIDGYGIGTECEIISDVFIHEDGEPCYKIRACNGNIRTWDERYLRKKKPPQELTTWEAVQVITGWNPVKQTEKAS